MSRESVITNAILDIERCRNILAEHNCRQLISTHSFRCLGYITYDKRKTDDALGKSRRWVKGYAFSNGDETDETKRIFETLLDRYNEKAGDVESVVIHEDDYSVITERKTFSLSDDDDNFQFIPDMHTLTHVQQMRDDTEAMKRRLHRMEQEKNQAFIDAQHFRQEADLSKEREKTNIERLLTLSRENSRLQQRVGNLESVNQNLRAKNMELEEFANERIANATENGSVRGMSTDDMVKHAIEKKKEIHESLLDMEPETVGSPNGIEALQQDIAELKDIISKIVMSDKEKAMVKVGQ